MSEFSLKPENYKSYFSWDKYAELDKAQRKELIKFSVEQISQEKGLKDVDVKYFTGDPGSRGSCGQRFDDKDRFVGHTLNLNDDVLSVSKNDVAPDRYAPYKLYNTMNHELEHASQFELASDRHIKNSNPVALEQRLNDQHYYNASGDKKVIWQGQSGRVQRFDNGIDYQMYRAQACEADARAAGYSAVESLKKEIPNDTHLDSYLRTQKAREINNNRVMMSKLGMHSREEMANEELQYISTRKLKEPDRQRVLEYARQKDFETAKEVLNADSRGLASEEELKNRFDNNQGYSNFYKTQHYNQNKVNESNHDYYIYAKHKWEEAGEEDSYSEPVTQTSTDGKDSISVWQRVKGVAFGIASVAVMQNSFDAYDNGYQTTAGYNVAQGLKYGTKLGTTLAHVPGGNPTLDESAEAVGRAYDTYQAMHHPDEVINFSPSPVSQEIIDKHTLVISDPSDPYGSVVRSQEEGDAAFFERVDKQSSQINMEADHEFFEEQDSYAPVDDGEDQSFFDKIDQKSFELGQKLDEKIEGAMQTAAQITHGQKK